MTDRNEEGWLDALADAAGDEVEAQEENSGSEEGRSLVGSILVPMIFIAIFGVTMLLLIFQFF